ncbi:MAG TPA: hemolysin III family protein [Casimicrobium huifangae]|jgi:hemolysin III|uniref:PAQR family membrane homeostasis protein TrhA n=1 Tax=Casimicrobium huifangae TaxID=2591109 RepID=UPI0012EB9E40|nr:hemolysin III family protein [Casimicrobium huifangae]HQD63824.1 hemolysin III family protein [Casimicrobium huifangae]
MTLTTPPIPSPSVNKTTIDERPQTLGEEIANSISHGVGLAGALVAFPLLVIAASQRGDITGIVSVSVFATTMVLLYLASTLFHALPPGRAKRVFQVLDHSAIFLLIAGTYTPFTLGVLRGAWGWTLFGIVWSIAVVGIVLKALGGVRYTTISTWAYLAMGWVVVIAAERVWTLMPAWGLFWLIAGGLAYTLGAVFFALERIRYFHFAWHLFVIAGTACHVVAVAAYSG